MTGLEHQFAIAWQPAIILGVLGQHALPELLLAGGLATIAVIIVLLPVLLTRPFEPFHPLCIVGLGVFMGTTIRSWYLMFVGYDDETEWSYLEYVVSMNPISILLPGAILVALGMVCLVIGYSAAESTRLPIGRLGFVNRPWNLPRTKLLAVMALCIAGVVLVDFLRRTGFQLESLRDLSQKRMADVESHGQRYTALMYHRVIAQYVPAQFFYVFLILYLRNSGRRKWVLPFAGICALFALLLPFLSSDRTSIIVMIINALTIFWFHTRIKTWNIAIGAAASLLLIVGMSAFRNRDAGVLGVSHAVRDSLFENENGINIVNTGFMYKAVPKEMDYAMGRTMMMWVFAPIPRALWPDKPETNLGYVVCQDLYHEPPHRRTGSDPGMIAEFYLNFGVTGVIVGMVLFGMILRIYYNTFRPLTQSSGALLLYVALLMPLSNGFLPQEVSQGVMSAGMEGLLCCLLLLAIGSTQQDSVASPIDSRACRQVL